MLNFDRAFEQLEPILFYNHNNKILKRVYYAMTWLNKARRSPRFYDDLFFLSIALETLISDQQILRKYTPFHTWSKIPRKFHPGRSSAKVTEPRIGFCYFDGCSPKVLLFG